MKVSGQMTFQNGSSNGWLIMVLLVEVLPYISVTPNSVNWTIQPTPHNSMCSLFHQVIDIWCQIAMIKQKSAWKEYEYCVLEIELFWKRCILFLYFVFQKSESKGHFAKIDLKSCSWLMHVLDYWSQVIILFYDYCVLSLHHIFAIHYTTTMQYFCAKVFFFI